LQPASPSSKKGRGDYELGQEEEGETVRRCGRRGESHGEGGEKRGHAKKERRTAAWSLSDQGPVLQKEEKKRERGSHQEGKAFDLSFFPSDAKERGHHKLGLRFFCRREGLLERSSTPVAILD